VSGSAIVAITACVTGLNIDLAKYLRAEALSTAPGNANPAIATKNMIWISGGVFWMGCSDEDNRAGVAAHSHDPMNPLDDCMPQHLVKLDGFWMDQTLVTNKQFEGFVQSTGYQTVAERPIDLQSGSIVFTPPDQPVSLVDWQTWWTFVPGANWRHPEGPSSHIRERADHPVVHIAWSDAVAYCKWVGKRLPSEAEFEFAARGGQDRMRYAWGNELNPKGRWMTNVWQGRFPSSNSREDGYARTSPVKSYPSNGYGLYDVSGNVWQWTSDWYRPDYYRKLVAAGTMTFNPQGPENSFDPSEPGVPKKVQRGGSFLCSAEYCRRYLVGSRGRAAPDSGASHTGFRCARSGR
jgi:formylglycine-generating enzyme required for sulfatase activity